MPSSSCGKVDSDNYYDYAEDEGSDACAASVMVIVVSFVVSVPPVGPIVLPFLRV